MTISGRSMTIIGIMSPEFPPNSRIPIRAIGFKETHLPTSTLCRDLKQPNNFLTALCQVGMYAPRGGKSSRKFLAGDVAQLGERGVRNAEARGSIPLISTISYFLPLCGKSEADFFVLYQSLINLILC